MSDRLPPMPLLDRMTMLFKSAGYYGQGRAPSLYLVATLMADLRSFAFAANYDNDVLNRTVTKREEENKSDLIALGRDPQKEAVRRTSGRSLEVMPHIDPVEAAEARDINRLMAEKREKDLAELAARRAQEGDAHG